MAAQTDGNGDDAVSRARIIAESLPYMLRYDEETVIVKYGGHAMGDAALGRAFAEDVTLLKLAGINPVVVHGGGPQIGAMLERLGIKSEFRGGLRVTDKATVDIVEMVPRRLDQQGDRRLDQRRRRPRRRAVRQGRADGDGAQADAHHHRSRFQHREDPRPRLRR